MRKRGIRHKVLTVILSLALGASTFLGLAYMVSLFFIRRSLLPVIARSSFNIVDTTMLFFAILFFVFILSSITITFIIAVRLADNLTAPILELSAAAKKISAGDMDYNLELSTGDEVEDLAAAVNGMVEDIKRIAAERERINSELDVAAGIQNEMLPDIFPKFAGNKFITIDAKMDSAREVGGDFYDFFFLDKKKTKIALVIADVSGKGVPAALFMAIAKALLKQQLLQSGDPAAALTAINVTLAHDNASCMFVTVFAACLDLQTGNMVYANGGHNPPLLSRNGNAYQFIELKKGPPPGALEGISYETSHLTLMTGDRFYMYTDGFNEAMNVNMDAWGNDNFLEAANKLRHLSPAEFDNAMRAEIKAWSAGAEQSDDITSIALLYKGMCAPACIFSETLTLPPHVSELTRLMRWLENFLNKNNCPSDMSNKITVAAEELFINITSYAYSGEGGEHVANIKHVEVSIGLENTKFIMRFVDNGKPFNLLEKTMSGINVPIEKRSPGGLGIFLVRKWMDSVRYERLAEKNIVTVEKDIRARLKTQL
jgi:sigma-B regulation protein RsbU (phosphoserine phosphatase)